MKYFTVIEGQLSSEFNEAMFADLDAALAAAKAKAEASNNKFTTVIEVDVKPVKELEKTVSVSVVEKDL